MSDFIENICDAISKLPAQDSRPAILLVNGQRHSAGTVIFENKSFYPTTFTDVPAGAKVVLKIMDSEDSYECTRFYACQTGSPHFHFDTAGK